MTIKILWMLKRKPGTTPAEFREHYERSHAAIARKYVGHLLMSYTRNYQTEAWGGTATDPEGFRQRPFDYDCITELVVADEAVTDITMTAPKSGPRPSDAETAYVGIAKKDARPASPPATITAQTGVSSVVARLEERRSTRRTVASGLIAAGAIAAMVTLAVASTTAPHADPASSVERALPPSPAVTAAPPIPLDVDTAPAEPTPDVDREPHPAQPAARASVSHLVVRRAHAAAHPAERSEAPKRAAPRSSAPKKLAEDPYGGG